LLAIQLHQHIADFLPDGDIPNYACVCEVTRASITDIIWKKRFDRTFDPVLGIALRDVFKKYASRKELSKEWICFDLGRHGGKIDYECRKVQTKNQQDCLKMLRGLILGKRLGSLESNYNTYTTFEESDARKTYDDKGNRIVQGRNLQFIYDLITGADGKSYVDIIDSIFSTPFDNDMNKQSDMSRIVSARKDGTLIYAVQLCLTPISLNPRFCKSKVSHFDISQYQAYATPAQQPIFCGKYKQDVNLRWLLHVVNFFKYHLTAGDEGLLAHHYKDLETDQYPQPWEGLIEPGTKPLKSHWKGAYSKLILVIPNNADTYCSLHGPSDNGES
jgi:hypothetical protein